VPRGQRAAEGALDRIIAGAASQAISTMLEELGETIKTTSRCGLGQTSPNPVLSTLQKFRELYDDRVVRADGRAPPSSI
jgi:NADH:ubiquinone oxidoreductase subunit F (NADH-binding)